MSNVSNRFFCLKYKEEGAEYSDCYQLEMDTVTKAVNSVWCYHK